MMMNRAVPLAGPRATLWLIAGLTCLALLGGCGDRKKDKGATQTAVKVNKEEITVHQINYVLQQQRGLRADQMDAASRQILERLVDQQLAVQRAEEAKLDRDPRVLAQLDAARREILARAYFERLGEAAPKPTAEEIRKYFEDNPGLFKDRRIFNLQEVSIEAKPDQMPAINDSLRAAPDLKAFLESLKTGGYKFTVSQPTMRTAEQIPMASLEDFSRMKDGEARLTPGPTGASVVVLLSSVTQPVPLESSGPVIEQFLLNERKRKLVEDDLKALRANSKIEYVGRWAEAAASAPGAAGANSKTPAPAAPVIPAASGGLSTTDISKGMGLK